MDSRIVKYQLKWCWDLSKKYRAFFFLFYVSELLLIGCSLLFIVFSKRSIDFAIAGEHGLMNTTLYWLVGVVGVTIILKLVSIRSNELGKMRMLRDLQNDISKAQMYSDWGYIKSWSTGDLQYRIQRDCIEVVQMITQTLPNFSLTIIRLLASFSLLLILDSRLTFIILAITPLFLLSKIYYKKFRFLNKSLKSKEGTLSHIINENLKFRMLIKTLGIESNRVSELNYIQSDILHLKKNVLQLSMVTQSIVKLTVNIGFLITFIWGVVGISIGTISFGTLTAFLQLVGRVQGPVVGLLGFFPSFVSFGVSLDRVREITVDKAPTDIVPCKVDNIDMLEITDLCFNYGDNTVLENVNLCLRQGESTAVLGASGRGKTTLIRLLLSVLEPQRGAIKLHYNGQVDNLSSKYRTNFGYVPQGDKLFSASIRDNLTLGEQHVSEEKIRNALYTSCAEFVYELPNGLDTIVGESGYGLSEGQAQRIAIARTLLRDSAVWLFDEVTSALDKETAHVLMERLKIVAKNKIFVFVTHDIHLAEYCTTKYYLN